MLGVFVQIVKAAAGEVGDEDILGKVAFLQPGKIIGSLLEGTIQILASRFVLDQDDAFPQEVDVPRVPVGCLTGCSNDASRRRVMPKTLKNPSQKDFASVSSEASVAHSSEKAIARTRISFQEWGMREVYRRGRVRAAT